MQKNKILLPLSVLGLFLPIFSYAQCPVCTIAVAGGLGLCRWLGISDLISGTWIGALLVLVIMWTLKWLDKKNIRFKFRRLLIVFLYYFLTIGPLYWTHIIGHPANKFLGIDKLVFGVIAGSIIFLAAYIFENSYLRKKNQQKAFFPFQKVVIPISFLLIISLIFYFFC